MQPYDNMCQNWVGFIRGPTRQDQPIQRGFETGMPP